MRKPLLSMQAVFTIKRLPEPTVLDRIGSCSYPIGKPMGITTTQPKIVGLGPWLNLSLIS